MTLSKLIKMLFACIATVILGGCHDYAYEDVGGDGKMINFVIHVYAGDPEAPASRATDQVGTPDAYLPGSRYERMHTLRIIIVRPDNTVEHNEFLHRTFPEEGLAEYPDIRFKVAAGETKKVYLFANEASMVTSADGTAYDFNQYPSGSVLSPDEIAGLQLSCAPGAPLIDNTGSKKTAIPMSEMFEIDIPESTSNAGDEIFPSALFITRTPVKFGFYFSTAQAPREAFTVDEIEIQDLSDTEYLLPRDAVYAPAKELLGWTDRYIYEYSVPENAVNTAFTFTPGIQITPDTPANTPIAYEPLLYFPETALEPGKKYAVRIKLSNEKEYIGALELPNLPMLPRNTFVKVNMYMHLSDIDFEVDVLPYTAVPLAPVFGFDELLPRPPFELDHGKLPPWVEIGKK